MSEAKYRVVKNRNPFEYGTLSIQKRVIGWFGKPKWKRIKGTTYPSQVESHIQEDIEQERSISEGYYDAEGNKI